MDTSEFLNSLNTRISATSALFDNLINLIPPAHYLPKENTQEYIPNKYQHNKKQKAPKQAVKDASKKAKKLKLDPSNRKSTLIIQSEQSLTAANESDEEDTPQTSTTPRAKTHSELKALVQSKIAEIRARNPTSRKDDSTSSASKKDLIQQRQLALSENEQKKEMRQLQKKERKNEVERKKNKKKLAVSDGGMELSKDKDVEMEENISYGNIDFGEADVKKKKGPTDIKSKLKMVEAKNAKLAAISALNPEKAASIADAQTWSTLIAKASGETVKDNPALLKKSIKREEKRKAKSTEKWKERLETVKKSQQDRARKREQNIMERSEKKKKGGLKRPGFEGGIRKKSRK